MERHSPNLVDSEHIEVGHDHQSVFSDTKIPPNLLNETTTDLKLNLLANQMKITVHPESEQAKTSPVKATEETTVIEENSISVTSDGNNTVPDDETPPPKVQHHFFQTAATSPQEERYRKIELLRLFHELEDKGVKISTRYTMGHSLAEMEQEYEILRSMQTKKNAIQLYKGFMMNAIQAIEFLNESYNPFDFHLKGWTRHVGAGVDDYDDIFAELYEKYKRTGKKMEPELKLLLMLVASATTFHASNTVLRNVPGLDDAIKNNPKIVNMFAKQMVKDPPPPPDLKPQKQMQGPNTQEFLQKMRQQHMRPPQQASDTFSDVTSTSRRKKKPGFTIPI